jgi:Caenorhabditis protein of unknown function, DUF268
VRKRGLHYLINITFFKKELFQKMIWKFLIVTCVCVCCYGFLFFGFYPNHRPISPIKNDHDPVLLLTSEFLHLHNATIKHALLEAITEGVNIGRRAAPFLPTPTSMHTETIDNEVAKRIDKLLVGCGDICNTGLQGVESKFFPRISKSVDCAGLWGNAEIDASRPPGPAPEIPASMLKHFVYGGRVTMGRYTNDLLNQQYLDTTQKMSPVWTQELIDDWVDQCGKGQLPGNYGVESTRTLLEGLKQMTSIRGGNVLVIGSENPWVEACVLFAGALTVTTFEYGAIVSKHPKVKTLVPSAARAAFAEGTLPLFDAVVTFSSVEHSGLGRYGDALNPWGDLQTIARAWCITKAGGGLLLGVPVGPDSIAFNAHREYGPIMLSHLTSNWDQDSKLVVAGAAHPVYLFHKG